MADPYEVAGDQLGERMPRLVAKYQTELVAMQAVFTDALARLRQDRAIVEVRALVEVANSGYLEYLKARETAGEIEGLAIDEVVLEAAKTRLAFWETTAAEKEFGDVVLKLQEAFGALEDVAAVYRKQVGL